MKRMFSFVAILMSCLLLFAFAGCSKEEDQELYGGFISGDDPAPPIAVLFRAEKSKIKIGSDLSIKLWYFRSSYDCAYASADITATLTMGNWIYESDRRTYSLMEERVVRQVNDFAVNPYRTESIVIPNEWFVGNQGGISWNVVVSIDFPSDSPLEDTSEGGGSSLYYIKKNDEFILFPSYYEFYNYGR